MTEHVVTVLGKEDPLVRALAAAGCRVSFAGDYEVPAGFAGQPCFYLGNAFEQIKKPLVLARIRRALAAHGAPYVWWNRDAPWNCSIKPWRKLLVHAARPVDIHLAHSLQSVELFGAPAVYFPNAAEADRYNLAGRSLESLRDAARYRYDVTFVGTLDPRFERVRARVAFLAELAPRLAREGIACRLFDTSIGSTLGVREQVEIIQASRINLSIGAVCDEPVRSWGLPERCFGVGACGGFLLCDERKHAADTFPADAWAAFADIEDCIAQIKVFLARFHLLRDKAERLHRDIMAHHTYDARAQMLLELVKDWRSASA